MLFPTRVTILTVLYSCGLLEASLLKPTLSDLNAVLPNYRRSFVSDREGLSVIEATQPLKAREALCNDPSWDPTIENWLDEEVDKKLAAWWDQVKNTRNTTTFVDLLSSSFGDMSRGQECGIGKSDCDTPDCQPFKDRAGPRWVYFVRYSIVQMHDFYNNLYDATNTAESDFTAVIPDIANNFFNWDVKVDLKAAQPWITAVVSALFEFIPFGPLVKMAPAILKAATPGLLDSTKHFAAAGTTLIGGSGLQEIEAHMGTMQDLGNLIKAATQDMRSALDEWSRLLFSGEADVSNRTIVDYFRGGRFLLPSMAASEMSEYMFQVRVGWTVSRQWLDHAKDHSKKFVMCANATDVPCTDESRWSDGNRTCCLYQITGKAKYETSKDLNLLKGATYNFNLSQITASSVRTYLGSGIGKEDKNVTQIMENYLSVDDQQFLAHGLGGEGIFNLPVCDVGGQSSWVASSTADPPMLPCCCGPYCSETLTFYNASGMFHWRPGKDDNFKKALDSRCKKQYDTYIADWSRGTHSQKVMLPLLGLGFLLATGFTVLL